MNKKYLYAIITVLIIVALLLGIVLYERQKEYKQASENTYNMAFYELVDYVQNVQVYLAKSLISTTPEHGAETLTSVWREANLAQSYLSMLPIESNELENTEKFLNQVSDYSYSLSRKNIYNESLSEDDLNNLNDLHEYSVELENTLNQLAEDLNSGRFTWSDLTKEDTTTFFAQQVDNVSKESFSNLEENFHEYSGLIYDGAFSEHLTNTELKGLAGDDIDENEAEDIAKKFVGEENVKVVSSLGLSENTNIECYNFWIKNNNDENINIAVSKKGGHVTTMNKNRDIDVEVITEENAVELGKKFLEEKGLLNMKETYYLKNQGILTINYAYIQNDVVMYPDLIKVKVALDDGEILGLETSGYYNNHLENRDVSTVEISVDDAKKTLNKNLEILSEGLAVIPTEWQTEILCYEFKGKLGDLEFLVYINAKNGNEEDILVITNTPNGTLTM